MKSEFAMPIDTCLKVDIDAVEIHFNKIFSAITKRHDENRMIFVLDSISDEKRMSTIELIYTFILVENQIASPTIH